MFPDWDWGPLQGEPTRASIGLVWHHEQLRYEPKHAGGEHEQLQWLRSWVHLCIATHNKSGMQTAGSVHCNEGATLKMYHASFQNQNKSQSQFSIQAILACGCQLNPTWRARPYLEILSSTKNKRLHDLSFLKYPLCHCLLLNTHNPPIFRSSRSLACGSLSSPRATACAFATNARAGGLALCR